MTTSADETGQAVSEEVSEADRLAWLRIERALRGMRWWMLFLAVVAVLLGGLFIGGGMAEFFELGEVDNPTDCYWMIPAGILLILAGMSLMGQAITMVWTSLRIRSFLRTRLLDKALGAYFSVWLFAAAFGVTIAGFMGCMFAGYLIFMR